jgi:heterodisulfide reductase subunit B
VENVDKAKKVTKVGLFLGCVIPTEQYAYELSLRKVMPELAIDLIDLDGFSCCGAPLRSINLNLSMYLSLRNLAICEMAGLDMLAPCPICHLALTEAKEFVHERDNEEVKRYKSMLAEEGLEFNGKLTLYHTLDLLHDVVGLDRIADKVKKPFENIEFACHYGCHLIRPTESNRPDDAEHPEKMENILEVLGVNVDQSLNYPEKLNCCGGPLILNLTDSALTKTGQKLQAVMEHGFSGLVDTCPWGHRLFDSRQKNAADTVGVKLEIPVLYLTQIIGLAFGLSPNDLGLNLNLSPIDKIDSLKIYLDSDNKPEVNSSTPDNPAAQESTEQNNSTTIEGGD